MKKKNSQLLLVSGISALLISLVVYGWVMFQLFVPYGYNTSPVMIEIPYGMSSQNIAKVLRQNKVIRNEVMFRLIIKFGKKETGLRAGAFLFENDTSLMDVIENLENENGAARLIRITIPEGYTIWDIGRVLSKKHVVQYSAFVDYAHHEAKDNLKDDFPFLADIPTDTLEGYLFPDTYYFSPGTPPPIIVRMLLREFEKRILPIWKQKNISGSNDQQWSLHKYLTLASLIEKEAAQKSEMPMISSVFHNRLSKKMTLSSDPTVVYALGKSHQERVVYRDLKVDSPYNTYRYEGVPPSPISTVSIDSFKAAMNPEKSAYLFFVAGREGYHIFSKTYSQHLHAQKVKKKNSENQVDSERDLDKNKNVTQKINAHILRRSL